ncbi:hypothetical protein EDB19DRAFT_1913132 [Suillus lakei]|nr:hypothetical protein EDB19DRAFT_1913132 [Suillus lakei]
MGAVTPVFKLWNTDHVFPHLHDNDNILVDRAAYGVTVGGASKGLGIWVVLMGGTMYNEYLDRPLQFNNLILSTADIKRAHFYTDFTISDDILVTYATASTSHPITDASTTSDPHLTMQQIPTKILPRMTNYRRCFQHTPADPSVTSTAKPGIQDTGRSMQALYRPVYASAV